MKKLIKIELIKTLNYASFKVIIALHFILFLLVIFITSQIDISVPGFRMKNLFQFPHVWSSFAWVSSWFNLLLAIILIVMVGNEYSFKTFRQHIMNGLGRYDLLLGKGVVILFIAIYGLLLVLLSGAVSGIIFSKNVGFFNIFQKGYILAVYFIQAVGYMTLGVFITVLLRNTALSVVMFLLYFILIEPILRKFFPHDVRQYFPVKIISNLTPMPEFLTVTSEESFLGGSGKSNLDFDVIGIRPEPLPLFTTVIMAIFYIALFAFLTSLIIRRRDL
jgi:ABC-2 type transport system permease protein